MASEQSVAPVVNLASGSSDQMSKNEQLKIASEGLFYVQPATGERHTFADELDALDSEENQQAEAHGLPGQGGEFFLPEKHERGSQGSEPYAHSGLTWVFGSWWSPDYITGNSLHAKENRGARRLGHPWKHRIPDPPTPAGTLHPESGPPLAPTLEPADGRPATRQPPVHRGPGKSGV